MHMINKYFVKTDQGLLRSDIIDGPVYSAYDSNEVVGKVTDYNPRNGFMKIELVVAINYKILVKAGIPLNNIIFKNKA